MGHPFDLFKFIESRGEPQGVLSLAPVDKGLIAESQEDVFAIAEFDLAGAIQSSSKNIQLVRSFPQLDHSMVVKRLVRFTCNGFNLIFSFAHEQ